MNLYFSHMYAMITMICCKTSIDEAEIVSIKKIVIEFIDGV